jgi:hypothetical protein
MPMSNRSDAEIEQERIRMEQQHEIEQQALRIRKQIAEAERLEQEARARIRGGK